MPPAVVPRVPIDIWRILLWLAAVLLPLDVAVRRLVVRREDVAVLLEPVFSVAKRLRREGPIQEATTVGHLLARKKAEQPSAQPELPLPDVEPRQPEPPPEPASVTEPDEATAKPEAKHPEDTVARLLEGKRQRRQDEE